MKNENTQHTPELQAAIIDYLLDPNCSPELWISPEPFTTIEKRIFIDSIDSIKKSIRETMGFYDLLKENEQLKSKYNQDVAAYIKAGAKAEALNAELLEALKKAQQDINWMVNEGKVLKHFVFDYIESAIAKAEGKTLNV